MIARRVLLILTSDPDGPVVRHRWLAYRDALGAKGIDVEVAPWPKKPSARREALARAERAGQVLVASRLLRGADVRRLRERVRRLLFDFDDALPYRDSARGAGRSGTRSTRFGEIVAVADAISAGNPYLAKLAGLAGRQDARVLPTVVAVPGGPPAPEPGGPPVVLGWIGSRATMPYLQAKQMVLAARVAMGFGYRLHVIADGMPTLPPGIPVRAVPWSEAGEAVALDACHVGLAPLPDDAWTRGKCGLKVVQSLARGRPVVASAVGVQVEQVVHGRTGFLATDDAGLVEGIAALLRDADLRRRMGAAAREDARARWSIAAWAPRVVEHVEAALA